MRAAQKILRTILGFVVVLLALPSPSAWAQRAKRSALRITFSASDASCPSAASFESRFEGLVGADAQEKGRARIEIKKLGERFEVTVSVKTDDESGERRVVAETCQLAAEASALIAAISLFPERAEEIQKRAEAAGPFPVANTQEEKPAEPSAEEQQSDARVSEADTGASDNTESSNQTKLLFVLAAGGAFDATSMPNVALGFGGVLGLNSGALSVEIHGAAYLSQVTEQRVDQSAEFYLQSLGVRGCYALSLAKTRFSPCLGAIGIRVVGVGKGTDRTYERNWLYGGPAASGVLQFGITRAFSVRLDAAAFVNTSRPRFLLNGAEIHRPSLFGFQAFFGPELRF